jgi:hypothetical protein
MRTTGRRYLACSLRTATQVPPGSGSTRSSLLRLRSKHLAATGSVEEEHCRLCDGSRAVIGIGVPEIIGIAGEGSARTEFCIQVLLGRRPANGWEVEDIERT